jgi:hypothetical protein
VVQLQLVLLLQVVQLLVVLLLVVLQLLVVLLLVMVQLVVELEQKPHQKLIPIPRLIIIYSFTSPI